VPRNYDQRNIDTNVLFTDSGTLPSFFPEHPLNNFPQIPTSEMSTIDSKAFKFYTFFFKWIDPIIALGGAYLNFFDPIGAVTSMAPNSKYDSDQVFLFHQSGGLALTVACLSAAIPRYSKDITVWRILQFSLLLSDLAGISGVGFAMARQGRLGGLWTSDDWGCGVSYVFLTLVRLHFLFLSQGITGMGDSQAVKKHS
jgi:hypothetical protein